MRRWSLAMVLVVLGVAALAAWLGLRPLSQPALCAQARTLGVLLLALALPARRVRLDQWPPGPVGFLIALSLLVSLAVLADQGPAFLRQVRTQAHLDGNQKRAAFLEYQVGLSWEEIERVRRTMPEGEAALVLWNRQGQGYPVQLVNYYLQPRRLFVWREGPRPGLQGERTVALPPEDWLRSRGIRWALHVSGPGGNRVSLWRLQDGREVEP
jgi:hypothetical protein